MPPFDPEHPPVDVELSLLDEAQRTLVGPARCLVFFRNGIALG
jgi:hypothetical protein